MSQPLFRNILQIGIVVENVDATVVSYCELLGLEDWQVNYVDTEAGVGKGFYTGDKPIVARAKIAWINIGNVELELIEPRDEESVYASFLREKGPGVHHVMFEPADYDKCTEAMAGSGISVVGGGELQESRFQMFDTEKALGLVCEIADGGPLVPDESL